MSKGSLGYGTIASAGTILYKVPQNTQTQINLMCLPNNQASITYLSMYKVVRGVKYLISPLNMTLPPGYMAQEDGVITLNANDYIFAISSIDGGIDFTIEGEEVLVSSLNTTK